MMCRPGSERELYNRTTMNPFAATFRLVSVLLALAQAGPVTGPAVRVVHVFVALADNQHQGIVPVPPKLGDGDLPASNLYWGASFGVKTYLRSSSDWKLVSAGPGRGAPVLERCVFGHRSQAVYIVADAYRGSNIREAVTDFLSAAAGLNSQLLRTSNGGSEVLLPTGGGSDLVVYIGHDAFMDFQVRPISGASGTRRPGVIILACASKAYFGPYLKYTAADPLLWTNGLMAPEAYTLKAALDGWIAHEDGDSVRMRAAQAYDKYQHCGLRAAERLFATGW